ncbi:MAG: DUF885 domain-containing protein [Gemmatimonadota bacterium]
MRPIPIVGVLSLVCVACTVSSGGGDSALTNAISDAWEFEKRENPLFATTTGDKRYDADLPRMREEDLTRRRDTLRVYLQRLDGIDTAGLGVSDRINRTMLRDRLGNWLATLDAEEDRIPILADDGFHIDFAQLPTYAPRETVEDVERYIARLNQTPRYFREYIALMRRGIDQGYTMPRIVLEGYDVTIATHIVSDPQASVFYRPLTLLPAAMPDSAKERLRTAARRAIADSVVAAYREFLSFMNDTYRPAARLTTAARDLPGGDSLYYRKVRFYTTLNVTPDSIHAIGLSEVARIEAEMRQVMQNVGFRGDLKAFIAMLRTNPRFYAKTPDELIQYASWIAKKMDGKLPALFGRLPRQPYTVEKVPDHLAPKYTGGRYVDAPIESPEPGRYWVNTYNLSSRPLYVLPSLTLHEAVPGHHLQRSLTQELEGLPEFRRYTYVNAFGEGWGLYSERLGIEAGMYSDPYADFGRLTYEMWRACRLVVDTGLHWQRWTRDQAMQYMADRTALSLHEVRTETDRYIAWPGQALAYKMGELTIRRLRGEAEQALGPRFDVRGFHDAVLANGTVTLGVLEEQVRTWVQSRRDSL